MIWYKTLAIL